jgi:hypothetical protein
MATVSTSEVPALAILFFPFLLKSKDVRPNDMLAAGQVNQQFLANGGKWRIMRWHSVRHRTRLARTAYKEQTSTDGNCAQVGTCINFE